MTIVIPMAGKGSRFINKGYKKPKFMVEVKNKTLFEYSLNSLPIKLATQIIFICLSEHKRYDLEKFIHMHISHDNIKIIYLDEVTKGQAQTVCKAEYLVSKDDELLIFNIDTCFKSEAFEELFLDKTNDGILGTFIDKSLDDKRSFAKVDDNNYVIKTTEKVKISDYALTGMYFFRKSKDFFKIANAYIKDEKTTKGEYYIAPMYNDLILENKKYVLDVVKSFIPLGTPEEVELFE